jgi:L-lactate dehydrogenase complex protein LldG
MTDDRNKMLLRIRRSLDSAVLPGRSEQIPPPIAPCEMDRTKLVENFVREADAIGAHVCPAETAKQAAEIAISLLRKAETSSDILAWDDSELPVPELGSAVRAAGFRPLDTNLPDDPELRRARLAELGRASAGLSGAQAGLADSGTLVLWSGTGRPRMASLLPPVHIALLSKRAIFPTMAAFMAGYPKTVLQASNLVFITGPSRTADIEQALTLGVHGPREVFIIIVD